MKQISASIIIPTLNREQSLIDTIQCALNQDLVEYEVIVVDQTEKHSTKVIDALEMFTKDNRFRLVKERQKSLPNARNVGIAHARGEYIVFIDDDVNFGKSFLTGHVNFMRKYGALAVGGRVLQEDRPVISSPITVDKFARVNGDGFSGTMVREIDTFRGCNMAFNRLIFDRVGLFDVCYTGSAIREESDLAMRIKRRGFPVLFNPLAELHHLEDDSGGCNVDAVRSITPRDERAENYKNECYFYLKHRSHLLFPIYFVGMYKAFVFKSRFVTGLRFIHQAGIVGEGLAKGIMLYWRLRLMGQLTN